MALATDVHAAGRTNHRDALRTELHTFVTNGHFKNGNRVRPDEILRDLRIERADPNIL